MGHALYTEHLSLSYCLKIVLLFLDFEKGKYQSGQMGQTVNLLAYAFGGSNPSLPTLIESLEKAK